jgi:hypothetical protein
MPLAVRFSNGASVMVSVCAPTIFARVSLKCIYIISEDSASRAYVASFFQSCADAGMVSHEPFFEMAEEAATPGGLNEQVHRGLVQNGAYDLLLDQVDAIFTRLTKKTPASRAPPS